MSRKKTAVEVYISTVFKWGLIIMVCATLCAAVMFNLEKAFGLYPDVPWIATIILGIMDIGFLITAIMIIRFSFDEDGFLRGGG